MKKLLILFVFLGLANVYANEVKQNNLTTDDIFCESTIQLSHEGTTSETTFNYVYDVQGNIIGCNICINYYWGEIYIGQECFWIEECTCNCAIGRKLDLQTLQP
jgi:hypothetical protein